MVSIHQVENEHISCDIRYGSSLGKLASVMLASLERNRIRQDGMRRGVRRQRRAEVALLLLTSVSIIFLSKTHYFLRI